MSGSVPATSRRLLLGASLAAPLVLAARNPALAQTVAEIRRKGRVAIRLKVNAQNVYLPRIARTLRAR